MSQPECDRCETLMTMSVDCTVRFTDKTAELVFLGKTEDIVKVYCPCCGWHMPKERVKKIVTDEALHEISKIAFVGVT